MRYCLMYRDIPVISFNPSLCEGKILHPTMLPECIKDYSDGWKAISVFCSLRVLLMNRAFSKEILCMCNLSEQSDIAVCITSHALSFRDNFWIKEAESTLLWRDVNLYSNKFSLVISKVALTGEMESVVIDDSFYTGELTGKGTRAKCFLRTGKGIALVKRETPEEIASEVISYYVAKCLGIACTKYTAQFVLGSACSVCLLQTSEVVELVPCNDVMCGAHDVTMGVHSEYFKRFLEEDEINFVRMILFDYVTLNVDRNRDNFALMRVGGRVRGMYPLFDHDSCFKGKSTEANYFVTGMTFTESLVYVREYCHSAYSVVLSEFRSGLQRMKGSQFRSTFLQYKTQLDYEQMICRLEEVVGLPSRGSLEGVDSF